MAFATDWIVPEVLTEYIQQMYFHSSHFYTSGIVDQLTIPDIASMGSEVEIPFFEWIDDDQWKAKDANITLQGMDDQSIKHPVFRRYNGIEAIDLQKFIGKANPLEAAAQQISSVVTRGINKVVLAALQGATAAVTTNVVVDTNLPAAISDIAALENVFGDLLVQRKAEGMAIVLRSVMRSAYKALGLVTAPTVGTALQDQIVMTGAFETILGYRLIVDDQLYRTTSLTAGDALTYLVGQNAINSSIQQDFNLERDRDIKLKSDILTYDYHRTVGVNGVSFTLTATKEGPTDAQLRDSSNWESKFEDGKIIRVASIRTDYA